MKVKLKRTLILALVITIALCILAFYPRKNDLYGLNGEGVQIEANEVSPRIYQEVKYKNYTISLHEPMVEDPDAPLGTIEERAIAAIQKRYGDSLPDGFEEDIRIATIIE